MHRKIMMRLEGGAAKLLRSLDDLDLLVLGTRGFGHIRGAILRSVSSRAVRGGSVPVLIVPPDAGLTPTLDRAQACAAAS